MSNDAARHELAELMALAQEQMAGLAELEKERAALTAKAEVADGLVEVTVDWQGIVTKTVIDETYLDEFEMADLGAHITSAARVAAEQVQRRAAELLEPLTERRTNLPALSDIVAGAPDVGKLLPDLPDISAFIAPPQPGEPRADEWDETGSYPTVTKWS